MLDEVYSALFWDDRRGLVMTFMPVERSASATIRSFVPPPTHGDHASHRKDASSDTRRDTRGSWKKGYPVLHLYKMTNHYVDSC